MNQFKHQSFIDLNTKLMAQCQYLIVAKTVKNTWSSIGSCVLMKLDCRYFLVTAAHVINQRHKAEGNALYLLLDMEEEITFEDGSEPKIELKKNAILIDEDIIGYDSTDSEIEPNSHDIAVIELNKEKYKDIPDERFLTFDQVFLEDVVDDANVIYVISGYPSSKNKSLKSNKNKFLAVFSDLPKKDELFTISIPYHKSNFEQTPPQPQGMSGGGVWVLSNSTNLKPKLIGISVCHKDKKHVVAVKISYVFSLIKGFFPGTILDSIDFPFEHIEIEGAA